MNKPYSPSSFFAYFLAGILSISGVFFTYASANETPTPAPEAVNFETTVVSEALTFVSENASEEESVSDTTDTDEEGGEHGASFARMSHEPKGDTCSDGGQTLLPITIVLTKISCANESDLPNWGLGGQSITANTASDFLASHPSCTTLKHWGFEWGNQNVTNPGDDFLWEAGASQGWTSLGTTNAQGVLTAQVNIQGVSEVRVREVLEPGYLPFSYGANHQSNVSNVSAEMYCATDVYNYDNFDFITNPTPGQTYNCVAWNVRNSAVNHPPVITLVGATPVTITVGGTFTDLGATATDQEDGVIVPVVTGSVNTTVVGTYTIRYTATDSGGLSVFVERTVNVIPVGPTPACADGIDNDVPVDGKADFPADLGCSSATDTDENNAPVITLIGANPSVLIIGTTFVDPGATATDAEDGVLVPVATGTVNTSIVGTYTITYVATDSKGLAATQVTRTVNVISAPVTPPPSGGGGGGSTPPKCANGQDDDADGKADYPQDPGCTDSLDNDETDTTGGGGGGAGSPGLQIFNEKLTVVSPTSVTITWNTNLLSDSRVVYGDLSKNPAGSAPQYGYMNTTATATAATSSHTMTVTGLPESSVAFFRPVSSNGGSTVVGVELVTPLVAGSCTYLEKYLRLGYDNDPVEVTKLQRFLKEYEGFTNLAVTGIFDIETDIAVRAFQDKYGADVLAPWGLPSNTGYVYYTTQKKVNEIYCKKAFPLNSAQLIEISDFAYMTKGTAQGGSMTDAPVTRPTVTVTPNSASTVKHPVIDLSKIDLSEMAPKAPVVALVPEKTGELASGVSTDIASIEERNTHVLSLKSLLASLSMKSEKASGTKEITLETGTATPGKAGAVVKATSTSLMATVAGALGISAGAFWVWIILFAMVIVLGYITGRKAGQEA